MHMVVQMVNPKPDEKICDTSCGTGGFLVTAMNHVIEQFKIGRIWRNEQAGWTTSSDFQTSVPPERLFIERCIQFLKPGGRLAIVLPDSILGNPGLGYIRQWLIETTRIIASVDLHVDTFQPRNGTQTSILIAQKKPEKKLQQNSIQGKSSRTIYLWQWWRKSVTTNGVIRYSNGMNRVVKFGCQKNLRTVS